jgi:Glycosyltransferase family 87
MIFQQNNNQNFHKNWALWIIAIQFLALLVIGFLTSRSAFDIFDLAIYFKYSTNLLKGQLPYLDFNLEYPPLALLAFVLPRIATLGRSYYLYLVLFMIENVVLSTANALLLLRLMDVLNYSQHRKTLALLFYALFALIISPVLLWRYDLFPTLFTVLALLAVISNYPALAGIVLGLGIAAKLYPVFTAYYFANKAYRSLLNLWVGTVSAVALIFIPFFITTQGKVFSFLTYHKERGLQIESLPAAFISLAHNWGLIEITTINSYGSRNIVSPLDDTVLKLLPWLLILTYGVMLIACLYRFREDRFQSDLVKFNSLVAYTLMPLLLFIINNKVFSTQYIVWLIPFAALLKPRQAGLMLAICITTFIFMSYPKFPHLDYGKILWLNLRNTLILGFTVWIFLEYLPSSITPFPLKEYPDRKAGEAGGTGGEGNT